MAELHRGLPCPIVDSTRGVAPAAQAVAVAALGVVVVWTLYLARDVLLIIYISVLLAIGFGPLVHAIEHQQVVPVGQRLPRWLAILIVYVLIVGTLTIVGLLVVPPLIDQAQELWTALPGLLDRGQALLIRYGLLNHRITLEEAVRRAPVVRATRWAPSRRPRRASCPAVCRAAHGSDSHVLSADRERHAVRGFARLFPRADRPRVREAAEQISTKVSAWLNGQLILAARSACQRRGRSLRARRAVLLRAGAGRRVRRNDSGRRPDPLGHSGRRRRRSPSRRRPALFVADLLPRAAAVRESPPRAEGHGAAGRRQRRHRHHRAAHRRVAARHHRRDPGCAVRRHPPGRRPGTPRRARSARKSGPRAPSRRVRAPRFDPSVAARAEMERLCRPWDVCGATFTATRWSSGSWSSSASTASSPTSASRCWDLHRGQSAGQLSRRDRRPGAGLAAAKLLAASCGIVLHLRRVHGLVAALTLFYLAVAIVPWAGLFLTTVVSQLSRPR